MPRLSQEPKDVLKRAQVRSVACPKCGANPFQKCVGVRVKKRTTSHIERWGAYKQQLKEKANVSS